MYEGEDWGETKKEITGLMDAFDLPGGYSWSWNRRMLEQDDQDAARSGPRAVPAAAAGAAEAAG